MPVTPLSNALGDEKKIEELASTLRSNAAATPSAAVQVLLGSDAAAATNARRLLSQLDELAVRPLLEANPSSADHRAELLQLAVASELAMRRKVMARLEVLLDDRASVEVYASPSSERKPPPRRVCDEAYVLMRRLVHYGEPEDDAHVDINLFLNAPDDFKDERIREARSSGVWNRPITAQDIQRYAASHPNQRPPPPQPVDPDEPTPRR